MANRYFPTLQKANIRLSSIGSAQVAPAAGFIGCLIIGSGAFASAMHFLGSDAYSLSNHFVSELGRESASSYAYQFNLSLKIGGLFLLVFGLALGRYLQKSSVAKYATATSVISSLSFVAVGVYPASQWVPHIIAAGTFFTSAMIAIVLFSYCIWQNQQRHLHRFITIQGFIIAGLYFMVLVWPKQLLLQYVHGSEEFIRPDIWGLTVLEWAYCLLIASWILTVSVDMIYVSSKEETTRGN